MALSREQILSVEDLPREPVTVPEWGGTVWVRTLSARDRVGWEQDYSSQPLPRFLAYTLCDETGQPLFTVEDVDALEAKNAHVLLRLYQVAGRLNKVTKDDVDTLEKNC